MRQDFKIKQTLKKYDVDKLETLNKEQFNNFISKVWDRKNYKEAPNIAKIAKINDELVKSLGLKSSDVFLTKKDLSHFRAVRKANYNQTLSEEEVREIPSIINNAKSAYFDDKHKNFFMVFEDKQDKEKINFIHFNVDELGNFIITAKKADKKVLKDKDYKLVGIGIEPNIP